MKYLLTLLLESTSVFFCLFFFTVCGLDASHIQKQEMKNKIVKFMGEKKLIGLRSHVLSWVVFFLPL